MFQKKLLEYPFLIMAHRGTWGGNIIQNTRQSTDVAYKLGADIVEIDISRSHDGKYYLFHDGNEATLLNTNEHFSELNSSFIDNQPLINSSGSKSDYFSNKLEDYLEWLPENYIINIDRSWFFWEDQKLFELLNKANTNKHLFVKSPILREKLDMLASRGDHLPYVGIIKSIEDFELLCEYPSLNLVGIEIIVDSNHSELLNSEWLTDLKARGIVIIANIEHLGADYNLFIGINDDNSVINPNINHLTIYPIDIFQTDWPTFLYQLRKEIIDE